MYVNTTMYLPVQLLYASKNKFCINETKHSIISKTSTSQTFLIRIGSRVLTLIFSYLLTHPGRRGDHLLLYFDCVQPNHPVTKIANCHKNN
jgi:hypothetical protein